MSASHVQIAELIEVSLDDINIPPGNHRQDLGDLNGLAESIRTIGLVQPITVRQRDAGGYELVAGQRRLAAARLAGLSTLPAVVRGYADVESRKAMAVENLNRKDLEPLEAAAAYQELLDLGIGNEEVAALAGTSAQQVSDHTSLLSLPRKVRRELAGGAIDYPTALLLTQLADTPERLTRALHNARDGWSLTSAVQHELHARELERKTESSRAELEKRGVPIIERPRDSFSPRARVRRLGNGWGCIPLTQAKHAREACHAAYIEEHTGDIVFVCIDVQRHVGVVPGIEAPADAKAERAAKRSERQAQRRALAERRALLTRHLQSIDDACRCEPPRTAHLGARCGRGGRIGGLRVARPYRRQRRVSRPCAVAHRSSGREPGRAGSGGARRGDGARRGLLGTRVHLARPARTRRRAPPLSHGTGVPAHGVGARHDP